MLNYCPKNAVMHFGPPVKISQKKKDKTQK